MPPLQTLWARLRPLIDMGVSENTKEEDIKHIRLTTILAWICFIIIAPLSIGSFVVENELTIFTSVLLIFGLSMMLLCLWLIKSGRFVWALFLGCIFVTLWQTLFTTFFDDKRLPGYFGFAVWALLPTLLFPRYKMNLMIGVIIFNFINFIITLSLKDHFPAINPLSEAELAKVNPGLVTIFYLITLTAGILFRFFLNSSEKRIREEKDRVTILSDKLRVYLPRQFVDSLAKGDRETQPDYRRKRLTIFFSDVQGFTKWTDKLDPDEVREILNHYLSEMSAIAHQWGGTIDKFIGDCLMIFFGDPEFTDDKDHAVRCVRMAMEMQEKMTKLRHGWRKMAYDEPLNIRIGINSGWATVGNFGSEDRLNYTALGSAVNLASRIENACAPDKITVSHTTYLLIEDEIECEPKGEIEIKGFAEPVKVYEVSGLKSENRAMSRD